jgi:hypothetical protein
MYIEYAYVAYTNGVAGVHTGGVNPTFSPHESTVSMEHLLDRTPSDVRGVKLQSGALPKAYVFFVISRCFTPN